MYILLQTQQLVIEWWQLGLTGAGVAASIAIAIWNINRANRKDVTDQLDMKADVREVLRLEDKMDKVIVDCEGKRKELKYEFLDRINDLKADLNKSNDELSNQFRMLLTQVIEILKEKE